MLEDPGEAAPAARVPMAAAPREEPRPVVRPQQAVRQPVVHHRRKWAARKKPARQLMVARSDGRKG